MRLTGGIGAPACARVAIEPDVAVSTANGNGKA